jgi:hypothetical protein
VLLHESSIHVAVPEIVMFSMLSALQIGENAYRNAMRINRAHFENLKIVPPWEPLTGVFQDGSDMRHWHIAHDKLALLIFFPHL